MTRIQHLSAAITSLMSDLSKHPGTSSEGKLMSGLALHALYGGEKHVRAFIEGFR